MNGSDLDSLARALGTIGETRRALLIGLASFVAGAVSPWIDVEAKNGKNNKKKKKRRRRKKIKAQICEPQNQCGPDCCTADSCFEFTVNPDDGSPLSYACCPAQALCRSLTTLPDQCCYPDETCNPQLAVDDPEFQTNCCRPCGSVCCKFPNEECEEGVCQDSGTARLARVRR